MLKKIAGAAAGLLLAASPLLVSADTMADLQAQIQVLLAKIAALQAQQTQMVPSTLPPIPTDQPDDYGTGPQIGGHYCPKLSVTLQRGSRDGATGRQVSELQAFLTDYFNLDENVVVGGFFGNLTHSYVVKFQEQNGLPTLGIAGSLTRAKIASICGGPTQGPVSCPAVMPPHCPNGTLVALTNLPNGCSAGYRCQPSELPSICPVYSPPLCGPNQHIEFAPKLPNGCDGGPRCVDNSTVKCGVNTFVLNEPCDGETGFRMVTIQCHDGSNVVLGGPTSCKSSETWKQYADQSCYNKCSNTQPPICPVYAPPYCPDGTIVDGGYLPNGCKAAPKCVDQPNSSIKVTAPNGGEQWEIGTLNTVTWSPYSYTPTQVNPANQVSVYLQRLDGSTAGRVMDQGKASLHTYLNIDSYDKWATPGTYKILVKNTTTGQSDTSDAPFTILPRAVDLKINGSDGPVTVMDNAPITLSWQVGSPWTYMEGGCTIAGVRTTPGATPGLVQVPGGSATANYYAYAPYAGSYSSVNITCIDGAKGLNHSDNVSLVSQGSATPAALKVLTPNGGENVDVYQPQAIRFSMAGVSNASIALYKNDQWFTWLTKTFAPSGKDVDVYSWVPNNVMPVPLGLGAVWKIYITGQRSDGQGYVEDKSDAPFSYTGGPTEPLPLPTPWDWVGGCVAPPVYTGPDAYVGQPYKYDPGVYNAGAPYPSLPAGLTKTNGIIMGTPQAAGDVSVKVFATNSCGAIRINFKILSAPPPPPPPPTGSGAVSSWTQSNFGIWSNNPPCAGTRYVGFSPKYNKWIGAMQCGSNMKYKLYMSSAQGGTYYEIADTAGHGQDHCELVNPNFTIPNEDNINSGTCTNCAVGSLIDVNNEPIFSRANFGQQFDQVQATDWGDLTTSYYMCGVAIGSSGIDSVLEEETGKSGSGASAASSNVASALAGLESALLALLSLLGR